MDSRSRGIRRTRSRHRARARDEYGRFVSEKPILEKKVVQDEVEQRAQRLAKYIIDNILTLRCPNVNCHTAFVDYVGCATLTCHRCQISFCGWCIEFNDWQHNIVHDHIHSCYESLRGEENPNYYPTFENVQQTRRRQLIIQRLKRESGETTKRVLELIGTNLRELNIQLIEQNIKMSNSNK